MDRVFLDANVLFSAAYRGDSSLRELWSRKDIELCTSHYALEEAHRNLAEASQRERLAKLSQKLRFYGAADRELPRDVHLPVKDAPILLAAMEAEATHLLTGDMRHFGPYLGKRVAGIVILAPGDYLRKKR